MTFPVITKLPISSSGTKSDAIGETWNNAYEEIDDNFDLLENAVATEFWNGQTFAVPPGTGDVNGHIINEEGSPLAQKQNLDFIGASVVAADGASNTEITVNGAVIAKNIEALSGNKTLTDASEPIQALTPDAARDVNLPVLAVTNPFFLIINPSGSGYDLTVKDSGGTPVDTVDDGETKMVLSDSSTAWYVLGGGGSGDMTAAVYDPATITEQLVGLTATQTLSAKTLTSPILNTAVSGSAVLDEDNMVSDSDTQIATQQSIKAYVDAATPDASETVKGIVEIATTAEIDAGTSETLVPNVDNLAESDIGTKGWGYSPFQSDEAVIVGNGTDGFVVPAFMDGWNVKDFVVGVHDKGITGTTDVQLRRRRAGSDVDMLSTEITLGDEFFASDGVIDAANDDLAEGDIIYMDVDAIHSGTAPNGLSGTVAAGLP